MAGAQRSMGYGTTRMEAMIESRGPIGGRTTRRRVAVGVAWAMPAWALAGLLAWPDRPWRVDLLSHFVPHFGLALLVLAALLSILRGTRLAALGVGMAGLALGVWHVAACAPPRRGAPTGGTALKVIQYNAKSAANDERFVAWLKQQDADLVCLIETPWGLAAQHPWVRERYPFRVEPSAQLAWPNLLLSKYPLELVEDIEGDDPANTFSFVARRSVAVTLPPRPEGAGARFLWTAMHPVSPRTGQSWRQSLREVERDGGVLRRYLDRNPGASALVTGDFNSAPTGRVHRRFRALTGLVGWSPVAGAGTWPSRLGAWTRWVGVPIDRVWSTPDIRVMGWEVGPRFSSDHLGVVAWVQVPAGARAFGSGVGSATETGKSELGGVDAR